MSEVLDVLQRWQLDLSAVADASGQYRIEAHRKLDAASHGICPECRTGWVRRARASLQPARI